ncbi:MAG: hypothetical protein AAF570_05835 [Bacteroidota bacterium]
MHGKNFERNKGILRVIANEFLSNKGGIGNVVGSEKEKKGWKNGNGVEKEGFS